MAALSVRAATWYTFVPVPCTCPPAALRIPAASWRKRLYRPFCQASKWCMPVLKNRHAACASAILAFCWSKDNPRPLRPKRSALRCTALASFVKKISTHSGSIFYPKNLVSRRPFLFCCSSKGKRWVLPVLNDVLKHKLMLPMVNVYLSEYAFLAFASLIRASNVRKICSRSSSDNACMAFIFCMRSFSSS